jgi:predicted phage terminase large subunit-like protein
VSRVHIPRASKAQAREASLKLEELIQRLREMEDFPAEERTPEAARGRRARAQNDFPFFAQTYLPELIQGKGCQLHEAMGYSLQALADGKAELPLDPDPFGELVEPDQAEAERPDILAVVLAAPRGHAKSTWGTVAWPLWCALTGRKIHTQLVSDTLDQAAGFVELDRTILQESPRIRNDWGAIPVEGPEGTLEIQVPDGPDGEKPRFRHALIQAFGRGQKLRGRLFQGRRPDLVVLDDVENDEAVESPERRKKLRQWFIKAVIPGLDPAQGALLALGTILHEDSLLKSLLRIFGGAIWRCWDDDEHPLWPERFPAKHLRGLKAIMDQEDPGSFSQEYENRAQGDDEKPFKSFVEYDALPERLTVLTHIDPALGKRKGCYTALITVGVSEGVCYVLDAVLKRLGATDTGKAMLRTREEYAGRFQSEDVAYQEALADIVNLLAANEGIIFPVAMAKPKGDKMARIESMAPHIETGRIRFPRISPPAKGNANFQPMACGGVSGIRKLQEQLLQFPKGAYVDGPDALQACVAGKFKKTAFGGCSVGARFMGGW